MAVTYLYFYFFAVPELAWSVTNPTSGKRSINEINVIIFAYAVFFSYEMAKLEELDQLTLLEHSVGLAGASVNVSRRLVCQPIAKSLKCGVKSLFVIYLMYGISPLGSAIRMAMNSMMFKADEQHLQFTFFQGIFGFYPILVVLGSRLLLVGTAAAFILQNSIHFIKVNHLSVNARTGVNLSNKNIGSSSEFEAQLAKSELLYMLDGECDRKAHLFAVSGTPKEPKMWNCIVGTTITNIEGFIAKRLTKLSTNALDKADKKDESKAQTTTATPNDASGIDVRIYSDRRRRVIGSSLLTPNARMAADNVASSVPQQNVDTPKPKSTSDLLKERASKYGADMVKNAQQISQKLHKEFDSMLGIDIYDKAPKVTTGLLSDDTSLYAVC